MSEQNTPSHQDEHDDALLQTYIRALSEPQEVARFGDFSVRSYGPTSIFPYLDLPTVIFLTLLIKALDWDQRQDFFNHMPAQLILGQKDENNTVYISRFPPKDPDPAMIAAVVRYWLDTQSPLVDHFEQLLAEATPNLPQPVREALERRLASLRNPLMRVEAGLKSLPPPAKLSPYWAKWLVYYANGRSGPGEDDTKIVHTGVGPIVAQRGHVHLRETQEWHGGSPVLPKSFSLEIQIGRQRWHVANLRLTDCDWERIPSALKAELDILDAQDRWLIASLEGHPPSEPFPNCWDDEDTWNIHDESLPEYLANCNFRMAMIRMAISFLQDPNDQA